MKGLFTLLKPAPHLPEIQDQEVVGKLYHYWRLRIFYSMFLGYAIYYFTRKTFTFAMPGMIEEFHFTKSELGALGTIFSLSYGLSKFISGIISDHSNPRYFMALGLFATGIVNIFFGLSSSFVFFAALWGLNGWFQGYGWPPCARFLMHWYSHNERGSWWSMWNISHNMGAFLIPWLVGWISEHYGWRYAVHIPALIAIGTSLLLVQLLRDTPQSLGLPSIEKFRKDYGGQKQMKEEEQELSSKELLYTYVLKNPYIWLLGIAYFFVYLVRIGMNDWTALFLHQSKGYSQLWANGLASLFELGGLLGSVAAGFASDRLFGARRGPVNALYAFGMIFAMILFWMLPVGYPLADALAVFVLGFAVFGPQMLIGVAAAELSHKKASATATGFIGWIAYLGAAFAGYPLGVITQNYGWDGFFWSTLTCCAISFLLLLPLWNVTQPKYS